MTAQDEIQILGSSLAQVESYWRSEQRLRHRVDEIAREARGALEDVATAKRRAS
jgi:hypothetical protein